MNKQTAICIFLKKHHRGSDNAISSRELGELFFLKRRSLQQYIHRLRKEGNPICSDGAGYYYAENQQEINATIARLDRLVTHISNARNGLLYAPAGMPEWDTFPIGMRR